MRKTARFTRWIEKAGMLASPESGDLFGRGLICLSVICCFLPVYCTVIPLIALCVYALSGRERRRAMWRLPFAKVTFVLFPFIIIVPICHLYAVGVGVGVLICILIICAFYIRTEMTGTLFQRLLDMACVGSIFATVWAAAEMAATACLYAAGWYIPHITLQGFSYRPNSVFANPNYYAEMIEFVVLICVYRLIGMEDKIGSSVHARRFYIITILINLAGLYLSNCRSGWLPIFAGILVLLFLTKRIRLFLILLAAFAVIVAAALIGSTAGLPLLPRLTDLSGFTYHLRSSIWWVAWQAICRQPLFGYGGLGYIHIWNEYVNPLFGRPYFEWHSHNILLELLLDFGMIGAVLLILVVVGFLRKGPSTGAGSRRLSGALSAAALASVVVHGVTDVPILWIQTGFFLLVMLSGAALRFTPAPVSEAPSSDAAAKDG